MAKKVTLNELADMLTHVVNHMATKDDIAQLRIEMATRSQLASLHEQVNSIEAELKHGRFETRLGDLETEVFGGPRR